MVAPRTGQVQGQALATVWLISRGQLLAGQLSGARLCWRQRAGAGLGVGARCSSLAVKMCVCVCVCVCVCARVCVSYREDTPRMIASCQHGSGVVR